MPASWPHQGLQLLKLTVNMLDCNHANQAGWGPKAGARAGAPHAHKRPRRAGPALCAGRA